MTDAEKQQIDAMDYEDMLRLWRLSPVGNPLFRGTTGDYFITRMGVLRNSPGTDHVATSKRIGWDRPE